MVKKIIKVIAMGVLIIMSIGHFAGCDNTYKDRVDVIIKEEFYDKFINKDFTSEDFNFDNIKDIHYYFLAPIGYQERDDIKGSDYVKYVRIVLKSSGKKRIKEAIEHFEKLDFVQEAKQAKHDDPGYSLKIF